MHSERSALVGGGMWRPLARRFVETEWTQTRVCTKQMTNFLGPSPTEKKNKTVFVQVREKTAGRRCQALAPLTTDPPDIFEDVIYTRWPCPIPRGLAVG